MLQAAREACSGAAAAVEGVEEQGEEETAAEGTGQGGTGSRKRSLTEAQGSAPVKAHKKNHNRWTAAVGLGVGPRYQGIMKASCASLHRAVALAAAR